MMKRIITASLLLAAACVLAPAQSLKDKLDELGDQPLVGSSDSKFSLDVTKYIRFGDHLVDGDLLDSGKSDEFVMNVFEAKLQAANWFALTAGLDCKWDRFWAKKNQIINLDTEGKVLPPFDAECKKSMFKLFSLATPVKLNFSVDKWNFNLGGEALFALSGRTKTVTKEDIGDTVHKTKYVIKGAHPDTIVWAWLAEVAYDDLGIYFRYCPKPVVKDYVEIVYSTLGFYVRF